MIYNQQQWDWKGKVGKQVQTVICEQYVYYLNTGAICKRND